MAGSSLRRVKMDDYNTKVRPYNQLDKASHIERGPLPPLLLTVSQRGSHRYSQFHGWPSPFKNVQIEPQFSPLAGGCEAPASRTPQTSHIGLKSSPPHLTSSLVPLLITLQPQLHDDMLWGLTLKGVALGCMSPDRVHTPPDTSQLDVGNPVPRSAHQHSSHLFPKEGWFSISRLLNWRCYEQPLVAAVWPESKPCQLDN